MINRNRNQSLPVDNDGDTDEDVAHHPGQYQEENGWKSDGVGEDKVLLHHPPTFLIAGPGTTVGQIAHSPESNQ